MALTLSVGARANGRFPRAERLIEDPQDSSHLLLAATYGLLVTHDRGQSWFHVCEAAFAEPGQQTDPVVALLPDGTLLTSIYSSLSRSTDGACDFQQRLAGDPAHAVPDFTIDGDGVAVAVLVTAENGASKSQLRESLDGGQGFHALGEVFPESMRLVATVDVAPSDPNRIYVSGLGLGGVGVLLRSNARGKTFTELPLPVDEENDEVPYIAAVDPNNADALYVRTDVWQYDELSGIATAADALLYSSDGGEHFTELWRAGGKLFGFALSPDGEEVLLGYGDPVEGGGRFTDSGALGIYRARAGSGDFTKVYDGAVSCLTWTAQGVYACTAQAKTGYALGFATAGSVPLIEPVSELSFEPLLSLLEVEGPLACGECTSSARCSQSWQATCAAWGRSDCELTRPTSGGASSCPDDAEAGASSGGAAGAAFEPLGGSSSNGGAGQGQGGTLIGSSAGTAHGGDPRGSEPPPGSGCGCRAAGSPHNSGLATWAVLGVFAVWRRRARLLLPLLALAGCSEKAAPKAQPAETEECTGDFDVFEPGMTQLAEPGDITVELTHAEPSPPVVRRDNVWWLKLADAEGKPISGATLLASPYMPKHQHGSAEVVVEDLGEGEYRLSPIELIMPGVWEIPLSVAPEGGEASETSFRFCIAER